LKIVILQGAFLPVPAIQGGAVEKIWYRMGQEFAGLGHEVLHISRSHHSLPNLEVYLGVHYERIAGYDIPAGTLRLKWYDFLYSLRAIKRIPKDADVIVTNTFWSPLLLRGQLGKKVYIDVQRVPRGQMKFYQHVGNLRACSPAIYEAVKKEIPNKAHRLLTYVPNPVPFDIKPLSIPKERIILFVGRLHPEKGVAILLQAFAILKGEFGNEWKLIIVGPHDIKEGGGGNVYYQQLTELSHDLNVEFSGPVFNEDVLIKHFARASIFCYPSQEGSGDAAPVAPREAMAYGCVPVVSQLGCFNDFIHNSENGTIYNHNSNHQPEELAEAIAKLIRAPEVLKKMSEKGKLVNQKYAPTIVARQFLKDFEKLSS
jgi:glycosyltransferase involved in cell wall biosynthesis